jgi:hypothetical protein
MQTADLGVERPAEKSYESRMPALRHLPDGRLEDEDQEDEEAAGHVEATEDPQNGLY